MEAINIQYNDNEVNKKALSNLGGYVIKMIIEPNHKTKMSYEFRFNKEILN